MKHLHLLMGALALTGGCLTLSTHPLRTPRSWAAVRSAEQCQLWLLAPILTVQDRPTIASAATKLQEDGTALELVAVEQNLYWYVVAGRWCVTAYGEPRAGRATSSSAADAPVAAGPTCDEPGC